VGRVRGRGRGGVRVRVRVRRRMHGPVQAPECPRHGLGRVGEALLLRVMARARARARARVRARVRARARARLRLRLRLRLGLALGLDEGKHSPVLGERPPRRPFAPRTPPATAAEAGPRARARAPG
jgi:hypothetical protein